MSRSGQLKRVVTMATSTAVLSVTVLSAAPAHASSDVVGTVNGQLALTSVDAFVVDGGHHHLLFGSSTENGVLVTDLDGNTVTTLAGAGSIADLALTADGTYAYAASADVDKIYQIDLGTLTVSHTFSLAVNQCPDSVAVVSATRVAFGYACNGQPGGVGVLNPADASVHTGSTTVNYDPIVRAIPGTTQVVAVDHNLSEAVTAVLETTSGTPVQLRDTSNQSYGLGDCEYLNDIAVSPDGTTILTACGSPYRQKEYSLADFTPVASYVTNPYPTAVAYSPDGSLVAAGMNGIYGNDVAVFHHTASDTSLSFNFDYTDSQTSGPTTPARGLAFSADSSELYALAYDDTVTPHEVWLVTLPVDQTDAPPVLPPPPVSPPPVSPPPVATPVISTLTITAPQLIKVGKPVTFTGKLWFADNALLAGKVVTLAASVGGVTTTGQATVDATGSYSFAIYPSRVGTMLTTASFAGDVKHLSSHGSVVTSVIRATPKLALSAAKSHGKVYVVTAHLTGWYANHVVKILAGKKVIATGKVSAKGLLTVRYQRKAATKLVAVYGGDATDVPVSVTLTLH